MNYIKKSARTIWYSTLARRLISYTIIFSSMITCLATVTQIYLQYKNDLSVIDSTVLEIEKSRAKSIVESLWDLDNDQVAIQLKGIVDNKEILSARIVDGDGKIGWEAGEKIDDYNLVSEHSIPLKKLNRKKWEELGTLEVVPDLAAVYSRLKSMAIVSVFSNGVKTLLVACFFVAMFYLLIGRYLAALADQAKSYRSGTPSFSFNLARRSPSDEMPDELEVLRRSLNSLVEECEQHRRRHVAMEKEAFASRDALLTAHKELEAFAHRASHDLRAPVVSSQSLVQLAEEYLDCNDQVELRSCIQMMAGSLATLRSLIDQNIKLSMAQSKEEESVPVDVSQLINKLIKLLSNMPGFSEIEIKKELDQSDILITKESRLRNIIENLLSNSIKYQDPNESNPTIFIRTEYKKGKFLLSIKDNGLGIPKGKENDVFTMSSRFHSDVSFGSGLGMHLVQVSADSIGGVVRFQRPPKGCEFILEIPIDE